MMRRDRRTFTQEFTAEVVRLVIDSGRSISEVAKSSELSVSVASNWVQKASSQTSASRSTGDNQSAEEKLRALEKKHRELEKEHAFLKKTAKWFTALKE